MILIVKSNKLAIFFIMFTQRLSFLLFSAAMQAAVNNKHGHSLLILLKYFDATVRKTSNNNKVYTNLQEICKILDYQKYYDY